ncbi:MAG TPA: hypothetical protein VFQ61_16725 [Polyangiaceae bacterium]|nr:hypothetical protein [Polyangiaceae bacterium]
MLDRGEVSTRAELATLAELSPVRVSQILGLLRLHPAILAHIDGLSPGVPDEYLAERWLRPIARLDHAKQLDAVVGRLRWAVDQDDADRITGQT